MGSHASDLMEGAFGDVPMSVLLTLAIDRSFTGTLHVVEPDGREHHVRFREGRPTKARTTDGFARLGDILVERGVSRELIEDAAALGGTLGDVLELAGRVDRLELERAAFAQVRARVVRLFSAPAEASFRLDAGLNALEGWGVDVLGVDPLGLVLSGIRVQALESELARTTLASLGDREVRLHRLASPARFELNEKEREALELLAQRPMSIPEWVAQAEPPASTVRRLAFALVLTRHLGLGEERAPVGVIEGDPSSSQRVARVALRSSSSSAGATSEVRLVRNVDPRAEPDEADAPISLREVAFDTEELVEVSCVLAETDDAEGLTDLLRFVESQVRGAPQLEAVAVWLRSFQEDASAPALLRRLDQLVEEGKGSARLCRALVRYRAGDAQGARADLESVLGEDPAHVRAQRLLAELPRTA